MSSMSPNGSPPPSLTVIDLYKEDMKFSAGHFTIFSATERENLHGHNFRVKITLECEMAENGMCFDYGIYKRLIRAFLKNWDEITILPGLSPFLRIETDDTYLYALFDHERITFLKRDVLVLPIINATVEEFARLILATLVQHVEAKFIQGIHAVTSTVFSGPGQSASFTWRRL